MNIQVPVVSSRERISEVGDRLTPTERRLAEALIADPTLIAFGTVSDVADRFEVSRPSVVRFAQKLGFAGYTELQDLVREEVSHELTRPSQRIRTGEVTAASEPVELTRSLEGLLEDLGPNKLSDLVKPLIDAEAVFILSGETSMAGAHVLASGLVMLRGGVHLISDQAVGRDLASAGPNDAAVVIDFHRYRRTTAAAAKLLADRGVTMVGITDGPLSPVAGMADVWCEVSVPAVGPFDSSMPAVVVSELMVAEMSRSMGQDAIESIDRTEAAWDATDTFLP